VTTDRRLLAGALGVGLFALGLRLGPLFWSPLPFNPDGFVHVRVAERMLSLGTPPLSGTATDNLGYATLLAVVAAIAGDTPLTVGQPTSALVGTGAVLVGTYLSHRLAIEAGWTASRARTGALLAGLFLAAEGVFLYRTMPTDEQTAGILVLPVALLAVDRWLRTGRRSCGLLSAVLVVPLGPLHNLTGFVAVVGVTVVAALGIVNRPERRVATRAIGTAVLTWVYLVGYHAALASYTPARIVQAERLVRVPGLLGAWVVLVVVGAAWFVTASPRVRRRSVLAVLGAWFALVAVNAVRPVFPATTVTTGTVLTLLLPLALPALAAGFVAHLARGEDGVGPTAVALVAAPLAFVGTGLTARFTFEYLALVYRSHLFAHLPLLALAGLGATAVATRLDRPPLRVGVVVLVLVCVLVSAPVAYAGLEVRTYKSVTTEAELAATGYAAAAYGDIATDDHLVRVLRYHGGNGTRGPVYRWLREEGRPPPCPTLVQESWTTVGAQVHPQQPATLSTEAYADWLARNDVPYVAVSSDPVTVVVPREHTSASC